MCNQPDGEGRVLHNVRIDQITTMYTLNILLVNYVSIKLEKVEK